MLNPAFAVDGGSGPASMFRTQLWSATNGANGVITGTDLRVTALDVPAGAVNIAPGGALMTSQYSTTSSTQTYAAVNDATVQVSIPSTNSGAGRTDYLVLRVDDWHFDPSVPQPSDPVNATYCSFRRVSSLSGINYPFVALAKITIPAATTAITSSMITDLRNVANPRSQRVLRPNAMIWTESEQLKNSTSGEYWPNAGGAQNIDIPYWATRVKIRADWLSVLMPAGNCTGRIWVSFGDWTGSTWGTASQQFAFDNVQANNPSRQNFTVVDELPVPPSLRGRKNVHFQMWASRLPGTVGPTLDGISGTSLEITFEEVADSSTT